MKTGVDGKGCKWGSFITSTDCGSLILNTCIAYRDPQIILNTSLRYITVRSILVNSPRIVRATGIGIYRNPGISSHTQRAKMRKPSF